MTLANTAGKGDQMLEGISQRTRHHIDTCRAKRSGFGDYVDCLAEHPNRCGYALSFGFGYFCRHPERARIVAQTEPKQSES